MIISGIQKFTLLDFPGKISCIVFTGGCNLRCGYCHNPEFVLPEKLAALAPSFISESAVLSFLKQRQGKLQGVVITGGEPTIMPDLATFIRKVKALGFAIKLDSNGNRPEVLRMLLDQGLIDYVALDVKTGLSRYRALVGSGADECQLRESIELLKEGRVDYEFRSTLIQEVHTPKVLQEMEELFFGAKRLFLQSFRSGVTLDPAFERYHPFPPAEMEKIAERFRALGVTVDIRI